MDNEVREEYNKFLVNLSDELDIPPSKYQQAVERYGSVGRYLEGGQYEGSNDLPHIYVQGSFRLGTVVRPIIEGKESDYDIDLVCEIQIDKQLTNPENIKTMVGGRLKENGTYKKMLDDEGRRCWTLNYAEEDGIGFHLDVLPSVHEDQSTTTMLTNIGVPFELARHAIAITDKRGDTSYNWCTSNPNGYGEWFDKVKEPIFKKIAARQRQAIFNKNRQIFARVDDVPDPLIKTPLQRVIQIFKRHRDGRFVGHSLEDDKPISMIITTLSARLYEQQPDVVSTISDIVIRLNFYSDLLQPSYKFDERFTKLDLITRLDDGTWYIPNPVDPGENFADRWHENDHRKAKAFFQWVKWVNNDLIEVLKINNIRRIAATLEDRFGEKLIEKASSGVIVLGSPAIITGRNDTAPRVEIRNPSKPWSNFE